MRISIAIFLIAACATTPTTSTPTGGPRGLRASEHVDAAQTHDEIAQQYATPPVRTTMQPGQIDQFVAAPWMRSWDTGAEHERLAKIHRSKAAELEAEYEEACGATPTSEAAVSPLERYGTGGWQTQTGAIVYMSAKAGPPDRLLAAMKCHRAWMMLAPANMDDCPLDLPGLELDARGDADGITVSLGVKDPTLIPELQRRVAHDLEAGKHPTGMNLHKENGDAEYHP